LNFTLVCKAQDLKERLTEAWELEEKKAEVKQAFANHHDYINSLSHTEYLEWKRQRNERLASDPYTAHWFNEDDTPKS